MYPRSKQAKSVQEALAKRSRLSVTLVMEKQVKRIEMTDPGFLVTTADKETFTAGSVILACGGQASAIRGSRGDGYYQRPVDMRSQSQYRHLCNCMRRILYGKNGCGCSGGCRDHDLDRR